MQRVTKKDQPVDLIGERLLLLRRSGRNLRSDPATHRLPANHQTVVLQFSMFDCRFNHGAKAGLQLPFLIGNRATLFHVDKVERHDVEATRRETTRKHPHEPAVLAGASSMAQQRGQPGAFLFGSGVKQRRDRIVFIDADRQLLCFRGHLFDQVSLANIASASCSSFLKRFDTPAWTLGELFEK